MEPGGGGGGGERYHCDKCSNSSQGYRKFKTVKTSWKFLNTSQGQFPFYVASQSVYVANTKVFAKCRKGMNVCEHAVAWARDSLLVKHLFLCLTIPIQIRPLKPWLLNSQHRISVHYVDRPYVYHMDSTSYELTLMATNLVLDGD